jgi:antitoxin component YwqK of YwqJK toxin-antitoxin module
MRLDGKRTQPGVNAYCESTDKSRTAYVQLNPGGGRRQVCSYVGGRASGPYQAFHPNGARWLEGRYENGFKVGQWTQWSADGRKVADGQYRDGLTVEGAPVGFPATCETITW